MDVRGHGSNGSDALIVDTPSAANKVVLDLCTPFDADADVPAEEACDLPSCKKLKSEHDSDNVSDLTSTKEMPPAEIPQSTALQVSPFPLVSLVDIDRLMRADAATAERGSSEAKVAGGNRGNSVSDTALAVLRIQTAGRFLVQGTAVNIRRFRVTAAGGYVVNLILEGTAARDDGLASSENVTVPVQISSDLCAEYLGVPAIEYLAKQKSLSKEAAKDMKISASYRFQDFHGTFVARLLVEHKETSGTANGTRSQQSTGDGAFIELLLKATIPIS